MTSPAVTQQIHSLEAELKVRLFRRTTRNVELTREGILLLSDAKAIQHMKSQYPNFYPVFRIVPFQHLYKHLSEETVDIILAFQEQRLKKTIHYQELIKIRIVGIVENSHSLS